MVLLNASNIYFHCKLPNFLQLMRFDFYRKEVFHVMSPENYSGTFSNSSSHHSVMRLASICSKINCVRISFLHIYTFISFPLFSCKNILSKFSREKALKDKNFSGRSWYAYEIGRKNITCIMLLCSKRSRRLGSRE